MIIDKKMTVKVNHANRKKYEQILSKIFSNGDNIEIHQSELLLTSRMLVECSCDICGSIFEKRRVDIKSENTFCNTECRNEFLRRNNPNPTKKKIKVKCFICEKEIELHESKFKKQENFLCSRECYKKHRSETYHSKNVYNYQETYVPCTTCEKGVKTSKWYLENKKNIFCSHNCYWIHRKDFYTEFYYKDDLNENRGETNPERIVREWLESEGLKAEKDFIQECGFLRKYYVDFYIPAQNLVIEVFGDYWHVNPEVYDVTGTDSKKKPMHPNQKEFLESRYDEIRIEELQNHNLKVIVFWEKDIKQNFEEITKNIIVKTKNP